MKAEYLCPALTLFRAGQVDYAAQHRLYDRLVAAGLDGAIILGSSSEFYAMTPEMRRDVALDALGRLSGSMAVWVGTGCLKVEDTVAFSNDMLAAGATGVIVVGPYYIGADAEGIFRYYDEVAGRVNGDLMIYNYPERTGHDVTPDIINRLLARHDNVVAVKDTVESATHTQRIINEVRPAHPDFRVYSGFDNNFLPVTLAGGNGVIGAISNIAPELCAAWTRAVGEGDFATCAAIHASMCRLFKVYQLENPFMPSMKHVLALQGLGNGDESLLPAVPPREETKACLAQLAALVKEAQDMVRGA